MAANTSPIFPLTPVTTWAAALTTADATAAKNHNGTSGTAADIPTIFTAGANGARVDQVLVASLGTNVASVLRVFLNNGSANTTAANNVLIAELSLPATSITETAALTTYSIPINIAIPASYTVICCLGTTVATGWAVACVGGSY